jgi:uncharacterized membrane protein (UPF0127 family)
MRLLPVLMAAILVYGCQKPADSAPAPVQTSDLPTQAQPKLQTMKLWIGPEEMVAELALTGKQQQTGMMFRTNMDENAGMLFPLPMTTRASFWMMNCPLPLSAAYIDPDGIIVEIHDFQAHNTNSVVASSENIRFVLETNQGWFKRHNIKEGTVVKTERGSLMATFFRKN